MDAVNDVASEYVLPAKLSNYLKLSPEVLDVESNLLVGLKASTVEVICEDPLVRAIRLGHGATFGATAVAGDTIYERDFYPQLVLGIRTTRQRVLLLGNSGVGKSTFQFYLLARYLNPAEFQDIGSALPEGNIRFGSASLPRVVIRHLPGRSLFHVLFLEKCVAHRVSSPSVLEYFDPATTLYFFEPGSTDGVEPIVDELRLSTLATMSPNIKRYKQFRKDAATMYCPVYTKAELLVIGRDMRQPARGFPSDLGDLYSDANISQRFDAFNGIFRFVLPKTQEEADGYLTQRDAYLKSMDATKLINENPSTMVERTAGSYALMYDVGFLDDGGRDFFHAVVHVRGPARDNDGAQGVHEEGLRRGVVRGAVR